MLTVYSKPQCQYCDQAKAFLTSKNIPFEVKDIAKDPAAREFILSQNHRTVPQIYNGETLFVEGGWLGLSKMSAEEINAKLDNLVHED